MTFSANGPLGLADVPFRIRRDDESSRVDAH